MKGGLLGFILGALSGCFVPIVQLGASAGFAFAYSTPAQVLGYFASWMLVLGLIGALIGSVYSFLSRRD